MAKQMEKAATRIADTIVELVERVGGPVTFARIEGEIPGFTSDGVRGWEYAIEKNDREMIIWDGMSQAGFTALRRVLSEHRVAVQYVSPVLYVVEGHLLQNENWVPMALLPARAANVDGPRWLTRLPQEALDR